MTLSNRELAIQKLNLAILNAADSIRGLERLLIILEKSLSEMKELREELIKG